MHCHERYVWQVVPRTYNSCQISQFMVADLCNVLLSCFRGEKAKKNFAWRPFASPHGSTRHSMRCIYGYCLSYLCLAGRKVAMRKPAKITIWRVFAWRPKTRLYDMAQISHHSQLDPNHFAFTIVASGLGMFTSS